MAYRIHMIAAGAFSAALMLAGCLNDKSSKDDIVSVDDAKKASVPSKLTQKLKGDNGKKDAAATDKLGGTYMMGPLETELERLKAQADTDRKNLSQVSEKSAELVRQTRETQDSLKKTEEKIAKVQRVIGMLNEDPNALDRDSSLKKEIASTVPGIGDTAPLGDNLPALGQSSPASAPQTSPLTGGPATDIDSPDSSLPRNGISVNSRKSNSAALTPPATQSLTPAKTATASGSSLSPLSAPSFGDGPELKEASGVWQERSVPSAPAEGKILVLEGSGSGMTIMIDRGSKDGLAEGMLFEATGVNGEKNILVVTKVYETNAITKLNRKSSGAGLTEGTPLRKTAKAD